MKYNNSLVTFVDIMGFSDLIKKSSAQKISKILAAFDFANRPAIKSRYSHKVVQFSDSIVRVHRIDSAWNIQHPSSIMFAELISLVFAQITLINQGILIRGALAIGDIAIEQGNVFGPAMIDAYTMESKFAQHPRIIISPTLVSEMKTNHLLWKHGHTANDEISSYTKMLTCDSDGIWFIDYLKASSNNLFDETEHVMSFFSDHKKLIVQGAKDFRELTSISAKYLWLASYHNKTVNSSKKYLCRNSPRDYLEFRINESEIPLLKSLKLDY